MIVDPDATQDVAPDAPAGGPGPTGDATQDVAPAAPGAPAALPARIGRYHVLAQLGAGGMGVVLTAYDPDLDRKVALKLLRPGGASGSSGRLLREAHALARLSHPNVVQIYDTGAFAGQIFIAMELVRGVDLRGWLARPHPRAEVLRVLLDAGRGLAAAHDAGFVHRDFKPENVLVGADGRVRVADFGLVRQRDDDEDDGDDDPDDPRARNEPSLTRTGALLGTPAYMSPEQHLGLPADARSDQFSFCVALWEALHGQRPFAGDSAELLTTAVLAGRIQPPPRTARTSRHLTRVLARGMARAPEQRYPGMHALLADLARNPARARRRWLLGLGAAALISAAAVAARREVAEPCSGGPEALASAWDPARRQAVADALAAADDPDATALALTGLDAYADAWLESHRDACLDHRRGEQSSALLDARMRCLDRRRQTLATAANLLAGAPTDAASAPAPAPGAPAPPPAPPPAPDAAQLVARLPAVAACDDPAVVLAEVTIPEDPAVAAEVAAVESALIGARVRHDAGDVAGAQVLADEAAARARRAGSPPTLAAALLVQARVHFTRGAYTLARPALGEALTQAVESRRDDVAAEAIARLLYVDGVQGSRPEEALRLAPLALAMAARAPEPHAARGLAHNTIGGAKLSLHDREGAAASMARAVEEMLAAPRHDPIELAHAMLNAGLMTAAPDQRRAGLIRSTDLLTAHLGPRHPLTLNARALAALFMPDLRDAAAQLAATCPAYLAVHGGVPLACTYCFHRLAHFQLFLGDAPAARASAQQVLSCRPAAPAVGMDGHMRDKALALIAVHDDRPDDALAIVARARARIEPDRALQWMAGEFVELDLLRGRALLRLNRAPEAIAALEQAVPTLTAGAADRPELLAPLLLAETRTLLARALLAATPPDPTRAAALTAAATATLTALAATVP